MRGKKSCGVHNEKKRHVDITEDITEKNETRVTNYLAQKNLQRKHVAYHFECSTSRGISFVIV